MRTDFYFQSCSGLTLHGCRWEPAEKPAAIVQIVHGIAEHAERYDAFAQYLTARGFLVVAEDHMGHGQSAVAGEQGYFRGGWDSAVNDTHQLLVRTQNEFPGTPYFLFGHSMGSFMSRTLLIRYPDSHLAGCILSGTGWQPEFLLTAGRLAAKAVAKSKGDTYQSKTINNLMFGTYNSKVEHQRTEFDWLTRDDRIVDAYIADPQCGFIPSVGLVQSMMDGIRFNQSAENLKKMDPVVPVLFVSGDADPVGAYGKGVRQSAEAFRHAGMQKVSLKLYPLCRHEILNEWNCNHIFEDIYGWIADIM